MNASITSVTNVTGRDLQHIFIAKIKTMTEKYDGRIQMLSFEKPFSRFHC